jgi:hypothetical protein
MTELFDPKRELIFVNARLTGPKGNLTLRLALDTGATKTLIRTASLLWLGYDPAQDLNRLPMTTGSGVEYVTTVILNELEVLGEKKKSFPVFSHTLPPSAGVDGLLGLDFFHDRTLTLNFREGKISLE